VYVPVFPLVQALPLTLQLVRPALAEGVGVVFLSSSFLQEVVIVSAIAPIKNSLVMFFIFLF
jgi:hypothetical protein